MRKMLSNAALSMTFIFATQLAHSSGDAERVIAGPENAPITIEEFADFECVYCVKGSQTMARVLKSYDRKVKLIFRNLPLDFHPNAVAAAKAFSAVYLQDPSKAYEFYATVFANQNRLSQEGESYLLELADSMQLNLPRLKEDMKGEQVARILKEDKALAEQYKFRGTPSFRIGKEKVTGALPFEDFKKIIDRQIAASKN